MVLDFAVQHDFSKRYGRGARIILSALFFVQNSFCFFFILCLRKFISVSDRSWLFLLVFASPAEFYFLKRRASRPFNFVSTFLLHYYFFFFFYIVFANIYFCSR